MRRHIVLSTLTIALLTTLSAHASITVSVGYADNSSASAFFPSPWLGSSSVVSQTAPGQSLNAGAIRITNTTSSPITISNFTVALGGGQLFNFWSPLTIPVGDDGIFTQTAPGNFDTSSFGLFHAGPVNVDATHPLGGCTNPANATQIAQCAAYQPVISFSVNGGAVVSYVDSGHILDTFGYDLVNLPPPGGDGTESINWNIVGSAPSRNGTANAAVPEPLTLLLSGCGLGAMLFARRRSFSGFR